MKTKSGQFKQSLDLQEKKVLRIEAVVKKTGLTHGGLQWSKKAPERMNWSSALEYCKNLEEEGYSDWHLPNISELRTIIINCPGSQAGGDCRVKDPDCLSSNCWSRDSCSCDGSEESYSALGDDKNTWLWSSSERSDGSKHAWYVTFLGGKVRDDYKNYNRYVRCARPDH